MIVDAEVEGERVDVRVEGGVVTEIGAGLDRRGEPVVDAQGAALIPGLHDHHLHLLAMAAARTSIDVGDAHDAAAFDAIVRERSPGAQGWLRVVGYDERHGPLDAMRLDALAPGAAVRVQHRSGAAWVLSTAALTRVGATSDDGWLHRSDHALRHRWPSDGPPDLAPIGARLAALGVTGVTDCTPFDDASAFDVLAAARASGALPQRVTVTGGAAIAEGHPPAALHRGPVKVIVADDELPTPDALASEFLAARRAGRAVAVHCVSRVGLALSLAAWDEVGATGGDRIEHGSVVPLELIPRLAQLGIQVVTQPAFLRARGDRYLDPVHGVEAEDVDHLYRCRSLLDGGVGVGGSTDAPFGPDDPWLAIAVAIDRQATSGRLIGADESLAPRRALDLFLSAADDPGGPPRRVTVGAPADLCLLDAPLEPVLMRPCADRVAATWIDGQRVAP